MPRLLGTTLAHSGHTATPERRCAANPQGYCSSVACAPFFFSAPFLRIYGREIATLGPPPTTHAHDETVGRREAVNRRPVGLRPEHPGEQPSTRWWRRAEGSCCHWPAQGRRGCCWASRPPPGHGLPGADARRVQRSSGGRSRCAPRCTLNLARCTSRGCCCAQAGDRRRAHREVLTVQAIREGYGRNSVGPSDAWCYAVAGSTGRQRREWLRRPPA